MFVLALVFLGAFPAYFDNPDELPRWRVGLGEVVRFSPFLPAMILGSLWGKRPYPVWVGVVVVAAYGVAAVATAAWLSERGSEYAIWLCLIMLPIHLGEFLLFRWLTRRNVARSRQQPTPWQPRA